MASGHIDIRLHGTKGRAWLNTKIRNVQLSLFHWLFALAGVSTVLVLHLAPIDAANFYFTSEVLDIGHVLGFAALTYLVTSWLQKHRPSTTRRMPSPVIVACSLAVLLAFGSEAAQFWTSRDASAGDLLRDLFGIGGGAVLAHARTRRQPFRGVWHIGAALTLGIGLLPTLAMVSAKSLAIHRFPLIARFDNPLEHLLFDARRTRVEFAPAPGNWPSHNTVAVVSVESPGRFHSVEFTELLSDWSRYDALEFTAATATAGPAILFVRIDDQPGNRSFNDRFNAEFEISETPRTIRIRLRDVAEAPRSRLLNLSEIASMTIFMDDRDPKTFYIGGLRLH